ncbi:MAG: hypothetical protein A2152_01305 [Candidatus Levybacteria bacterium RBG_16_35_6]|nr:MAG: hypothetical protein A2152_01305 [Candidatus Levybacteria bacterium RBG_16_35_6]
MKEIYHQRPKEVKEVIIDKLGLQKDASYLIPPLNGFKPDDFQAAMNELTGPLNPSVIESYNKLYPEDKQPQDKIEQFIKYFQYVHLIDIARKIGKFDLAEKIFAEFMINMPKDVMGENEVVFRSYWFNDECAVQAFEDHQNEQLTDHYIQKQETDFDKALTLSRVSTVALEKKRLSYGYKLLLQAYQLMKGLPPTYGSAYYESGVYGLLSEIIKNGQPDLALNISKKLDRQSSYEEALVDHFIPDLIENKKYQEAEEITDQLSNPFYKSRALGKIGKETGDIETLDKATQLMIEVHETFLKDPESTDDLALENLEGYIKIAKEKGFKHEESKYKRYSPYWVSLFYIADLHKFLEENAK